MPREKPHRQQHDDLHDDHGDVTEVHVAEYNAEILAPVPRPR